MHKRLDIASTILTNFCSSCSVLLTLPRVTFLSSRLAINVPLSTSAFETMDSPTFYEGSQTIKNGLRCGTQLAIIFHHPVSAEVTSTIREATTALNKVLSLLQDDNASTTKGNGSSLFSLQGLEYAKLLIVDCGAALLKLETMVRDASLGEAHLMKKHHQDQEASQTEKKLDLDMLSFSVRNLLEPSEAAPWTQAFESLEICLGRLYELQHRLHLVTTRALSRDL